MQILTLLSYSQGARGRQEEKSKGQITSFKKTLLGDWGVAQWLSVYLEALGSIPIRSLENKCKNGALTLPAKGMNSLQHRPSSFQSPP